MIFHRVCMWWDLHCTHEGFLKRKNGAAEADVDVDVVVGGGGGYDRMFVGGLRSISLGMDEAALQKLRCCC